MEPMYLSIQPVETGKRIKQLLSEQNYTIREIQGAFGFENPQAIYKWICRKIATEPGQLYHSQQTVTYQH